MSDNVDRLAWLDFLRGLAILGVLLIHCGQVAKTSGVVGSITAAGQYGVQLFFLISAITISLTYRQHLRKYGSSARSSLAWLVRRVFRIWPLYVVAAILYTIESHLAIAKYGEAFGHSIDRFDIMANVLLIHAWVPSANNTVVPGGWSIAVEVTFYSLFPVLMIWRTRRAFRVALVALTFLLIVVSEAVNYRLFGTFAIQNNSYFYYWPPTQLPVILIGCVFFLQFLDDTDVKPRNLILSASFFFALTAVGLALGTSGEISPGLSPIIFGFAFCFLSLIVASAPIGISQNNWISKIGVCSYSVYLMHFALLDVIRVALNGFAFMHLSHYGIVSLALIYIPVVVISYGIANWSRRVIEEPGIELGRKVSSRLLAKSNALGQHRRSYW